eukprot:TRINITY_DN7492_c0_g1_i1.p2 TRINITY_DN7492_c0_g1~~TRINITY_DN7492_c0_g1_i1.p2  ORF type:complete len:233 (+),score=58.66 TRINITY_DN7492_c0_g1_i1:148-846(+)
MTSSLHIVVLGDSAVGKTAMLKRYQGIRAGEEYQHTEPLNVYRGQEYVVNEKEGGCLQSLFLLDTAGQDGLESFRRMAYSNANCFIVCYAVDARESLENAEFKWIPEIRGTEGLRSVPVLLCATKCDLREDPARIAQLREEGRTAISTEDGMQLGRKLSCQYAECSARPSGGDAAELSPEIADGGEADDAAADGGVKAVIRTAARLAYQHACRQMKDERKHKKVRGHCCAVS